MIRVGPLPLRLLLGAALLASAALALWRLEAERAGLVIERVAVGATPATLYRPVEEGAPVVVVSHGFAGSARMMEAFSLTLARSGLAALAYDSRGHGRNPVPMEGSVTSVDGVTARLVEEARAVVGAARRLDGAGEPVALLGHSMATDVVVRAARAEDIPAVVAVSMYSEAVTPGSPERLLIVSGAGEGRLRRVALEVVRAVEPSAEEGETVGDGAVRRRAVAAPLVGHVGVLWSPAALSEARDWLGGGGPVARTGPWIAALLGALVAASWPLAGLLPGAGSAAGRSSRAQACGGFEGVPPASAPARTAAAALTETGDAGAAGAASPAPMRGGAGTDRSWRAGPPARPRSLLAAVLLPAAGAAIVAVLVPSPVVGLRGAGGLAAFLAVLGAGQLLMLARLGLRPGRPDLLASVALLAWSAAFAWALDRYGASFAVTGPRWTLALLLLPGALAVAVADGVATRGASLLATALLRAVPIAALLVAMVQAPGSLGLQFTALPVLALFWLVFGTAAGRIAARRGHHGPRAALGLAMAFSLAASLPLFG